MGRQVGKRVHGFWPAKGWLWVRVVVVVVVVVAAVVIAIAITGWAPVLRVGVQGRGRGR